MFFINRGTVEVVSEDGEVVFAKMNEGKFFGEISLIFSCPRTASIRSESLPMKFSLRVLLYMYMWLNKCDQLRENLPYKLKFSKMNFFFVLQH